MTQPQAPGQNRDGSEAPASLPSPRRPCIACTVAAGDKLTLTLHDRPVEFVSNTGRNYWQTLITKMGWARPLVR